MKIKLLFISVFVSFTSLAAQTVIPAVYNNSVVADGVVSAGEWGQSSSLTIAAPGNTITYKVAYDANKLYVLCYGKLESANALFPEVLLDVNNSKSSTWENDDWWFHVSATDCESQGVYGSYTNCAVTQPNWIGMPNFSPGLPNTDTVEIAISWTKINFDPQSGNDLGVSLLCTNTFNAWHIWPTGSNRNNPSTWGILDFNVVTTGVSEAGRDNGIEVFPNPISNGDFYLTIKGASPAAYATVVDLSGRTIRQLNPGENRIALDGIEKGVYQIIVNDVAKGITYQGKLIVR